MYPFWSLVGAAGLSVHDCECKAEYDHGHAFWNEKKTKSLFKFSFIHGHRAFKVASQTTIRATRELAQSQPGPARNKAKGHQGQAEQRGMGQGRWSSRDIVEDTCCQCPLLLLTAPGLSPLGADPWFHCPLSSPSSQAEQVLPP